MATRAATAATPAWLALACLAGCQPTLESSPARVDRQRVVAVASQPAEARPGQGVTLSALAVSADGTLVDGATIHWSFCTRGPRAAENNSVDAACLDDANQRDIASASAGAAADATLPDDACALFGSEPAPPVAGEPPRRPVDPDATGGYYQPVRVALRSARARFADGPAPALTFGHVRVICALPRAPADVARQFTERYEPNRNPQLAALDHDGGTTVTPGGRVTLAARFDASTAERYLAYDIGGAELRPRDERLTLSWFASDGAFDNHSLTVPPGDSSSTNAWTAPNDAGVVHIWVVLRDDRGGVSWRSVRLDVR